MPDVMQVLPYANLNGTERHVFLLAEYARQQGWESAVALPPGPMRHELMRAGIRTVELPPIRVWSFPRVIRMLKRALAPGGLCHVHAAMELALGLRMANVRSVVFTAHCYHTDLDYAKAGLFLNPSCRATVSVSQAERDRLLAGGLDSGRHHTILNGIDLTPFEGADPSALKHELGLPEDVTLVTTIGRLSAMKRVDVLIEALASVPAGVHLAIAGTGEMKAGWSALAGRLGVESRVHWLGSRSDVPAVLAGSDIFATASEREGLSLACIEALASGLPLVTTDLPEFAEVCDPSVGVMVPKNDPAAVARAFEQLANDAAWRRSLGAAARSKAQSFSAERMGRETLALYEAVRA